MIIINFDCGIFILLFLALPHAHAHAHARYMAIFLVSHNFVCGFGCFFVCFCDTDVLMKRFAYAYGLCDI